MRRVMMTAMCLAALAAWTNAAYAGNCKSCELIKKAGQGFCDHCKSGKIYGLKVASRKLYDALAGEEGKIEELKKSHCPGCKSAAAKGGSCEHCGVFVVNHRVFHSETAAALARGVKVDAAGLKCKGCIDAAKNHGTCEHCKTQFVADRVFHSKSFAEAAVKAYETVKQAVKDASHCEGCALARIHDGKCKDCKVSFKHGKPVS